MPRIRTHKPEFWSHPIMGRQDDATKCMALALMNYADDHGYFYADIALVKAFARPFDDESTTCRRTLSRLQEIGFISIYEHPLRGPIGRIVNFDQHQRVDKPKPSEIKEFFVHDDSTTDPRQIQDASCLEGKGMEGKGTGKGKEAAPALPSEELNPTEAAQGVINGLAMTHRGPKGTDALLSITAAIEARQKVGKWKPCEIADQMISMRQKFLKSAPATEDYGALWFLTKDGFFWTDPSRWPKAQSTPPLTQPETRRRTGAEVTLRQILGDPSLDPAQVPKLEADLRKVLRRDGVPEIENIIIELRNERERLKVQRPN